jgi:uncharacterized protein (TIGR02757 family)
MSMPLERDQLKEFLDQKVEKYNKSTFISTDPIQIPHLFQDKEDIEIAAFLTATIAWGQRKTIITNARRLVALMSGSPYYFIIHYKDEDLHPFLTFVHRTFNGYDCIYFIQALRDIYLNYGGLEKVFTDAYLKYGNIYYSLKYFREIFFRNLEPGKTGRHISDVSKNSAAKRLNLFLRWMVRSDKNGVDFGLWKKISVSDLMIPLDLHSGNTARKLGLLERKQDDWKAVVELTVALKALDPNDPVRYDFALFGLGVFEKF